MILIRWMDGQSGTIGKQINSVHNEMHTLMHFYLQCDWLVKTWCHKFRWDFVSTKHTQFPFDLFEDKLFIYLFWNMNGDIRIAPFHLTPAFEFIGFFQFSFDNWFFKWLFNAPNWLKHLNSNFVNLLLKYNTVCRLYPLKTYQNMIQVSSGTQKLLSLIETTYLNVAKKKQTIFHLLYNGATLAEGT